MALFEERGYDRTTVSDIAARAKLADALASMRAGIEEHDDVALFIPRIS